MWKAYPCFPPQSHQLLFHSTHTCHCHSALTSRTVALPDTGAARQGPEAVGEGVWRGGRTEGWEEGYAGASQPDSQTGLPASSAKCPVRVMKNSGRVNWKYFPDHIQIYQSSRKKFDSLDFVKT